MSETTSSSPVQSESPGLLRSLGTVDLTWLYVVAIVNLNIVPALSAEGLHIAWVWCIAIAGFFIPEGFAVLELAERMPGEGGLYLWTCQTSGDFHGFLCGWCYWLTNVFFVPSLLFSIAGVVTYLGGGRLAGSTPFFLILVNGLLWITVLANIRGLGVGKWFNNIGGAGALIITLLLVVLALIMFHRTGPPHLLSELQIHGIHDFPFTALSVAFLGLVGLEIGPVMGEEVRDPRRTFPRSILLGGVICALAYVGATLALAVAVPKSELAVVEGVIQAIAKMANPMGMHWLVPAIGVLMVASIAGSTSAWVNGSARILFVCGLDRYLPRFLGKVHPRWHSPWAALCMFGAMSSAVVLMSFVGASVKDAYLTLLNLSAAIQMVSYVYLFLSLARIAFDPGFQRVYFRQRLLKVISAVGLTMTAVAFLAAFIPSSEVGSAWPFILKMIVGLFLVLGVACVLFWFATRRGAGSEAVLAEDKSG